MRQYSFRPALLAAVAATVLAGYAHAHGSAGGHARPVLEDAEQLAWGIAAAPAADLRTITVTMNDGMRFEPAVLDVQPGETVRIVAVNEGSMMHELVIGTPEVLRQHAEMMARFPGMEHDEPYMAHVAPGARGEIVWTFNRDGEFAFACLIPGHTEAGMVGTLRVASAPAVPAS